MGIFKGLGYFSSPALAFFLFFPCPTTMCFSSVLVRHVTFYSHTVIYLIFSLLLHCHHLSLLIDFDWRDFLNLHIIDKHEEICLALAKTGRKWAVQGLAGLGRWGRVLLPRVRQQEAVGKIYFSPSGTLPLVAAAEHNRSSNGWIRLKITQIYFFFHRQHGQQTVPYKLLTKAASCFSFVVKQNCIGSAL